MSRIWTPDRRLALPGRGRPPVSLKRQLGLFGAAPPFIGSTGGAVDTIAVDLDGVDDRLLLEGDLSGIADSQVGLLYILCRFNGGDGNKMVFFVDRQNRFSWGRNKAPNTNIITVQCKNSADTVVLKLQSLGPYPVTNSWIEIMASWDLSTAGRRWLYINDVDVLDTAVGNHKFTVGETVDLTGNTRWGFGANPANTPTDYLDACVAKCYARFDTHLDLSVEANRREFNDGAGGFQDLGENGENPTGTAPLIYFHKDIEDAASQFGVNRGTAGDVFTTIGGGFGTCSSNPSY